MRISIRPASAARAITPCRNGPWKKSGKMVNMWKVTGRVSQGIEPLRQRYCDFSLRGIDRDADRLRERDQDLLTFLGLDSQQRRPAVLFDAFHRSDRRPSLIRDAVANQIGLIILAVR